MIALPTTTVTVLRGENTDTFLDDAPKQVPIFKNVPASIIEKRKRVFNQQTQEPRTIHYFVMRVGSEITMKPGDCVFDEQSQLTYLVDDIDYPNSNPTFGQDLIVDIKLTQ